MRIVCAPESFDFQEDGALIINLFGQPQSAKPGRSARGAGGGALRETLRRKGLVPSLRAWDFLSIALSIVAADTAGLRKESADGWTRTFDVTVAVIDPEFWMSQSQALEAALRFLTTDQWTLRFVEGGAEPATPKRPKYPTESGVMLLSGGLDSLIGAIDLAAAGENTLAVSQTVRGDREKQVRFAQETGVGLTHLQLNHNVKTPGMKEGSQRARSLIFLAFGFIAATSLKAHHDGRNVKLFVCENGFIAINAPMTGARIGSLSTRTAHPEFLNRIQDILNTSGINVTIRNPYGFMTKGEMMLQCADQDRLKMEAPRSTSCGRFQRWNYNHCGRCIPCQIRRAAFLRWGEVDTTKYVFPNLGLNNSDNAQFDDVRSAAMAVAIAKSDGVDSWIGTALGYPKMVNRHSLRDMIHRGLAELAELHKSLRVK